MTTHIHPTAIIEKGACLDTDITVGPYAYIGPQVTLGKGTIIHHHATVDGFTTMGHNNTIFPYAYIGGKTHDVKFNGGKCGLKIGNDNVFREYSTVHTATYDNQFTFLGDHNLILAYSHIAHDCIVGNHLIMSSHAALGGHVHIADHVNIGWGVGVHQLCSIGTHSIVGATSKIVQDVPPFMLVDGNPAIARTINKLGLQRANYPSCDIEVARFIFKVFYKNNLNRTQALESLNESIHSSHWMVKTFCDFIAKSTRGIV